MCIGALPVYPGTGLLRPFCLVGFVQYLSSMYPYRHCCVRVHVGVTGNLHELYMWARFLAVKALYQGHIHQHIYMFTYTRK